MQPEITQKPRKWGVLILFSSFSTLICCALPVLLVSLGFGSVVASIYSDYLPFLKWFGNNSIFTFGLTASLLVIAAYALYRSGRSCPTDPELALLCESTQRWNQRFFCLAVGIWLIGAFAAFALPYFI